MHHCFAAGKCDDRTAEFHEFINPFEHYLNRDWL